MQIQMRNQISCFWNDTYYKIIKYKLKIYVPLYGTILHNLYIMYSKQDTLIILIQGKSHP
jgi:hypothetical protein